jgi:(p)ppGpp synthase/HD superfamily hydrolase
VILELGLTVFEIRAILISGGMKMIYTRQTKMALKLCFEAHKDQVDKSGMPYVFHPYHLAEQMTDVDTTVAALLHDVVEDTDYTLEDLRKMGFSPQVLAALELLTHEEGVPYLEYVARIKENPIAKAVKLADIAHNSDATRLDPEDPRIPYWQEKYAAAQKLLCE